MATVEERFWSKIDRSNPDGCWIWTAAVWKQRGGYGKFQAGSSRSGNRAVRAHRFAWELTHGPIPDGLQVCHRCDNPPCCNPSHLFLGAPVVNSRDMVAKGRSNRGEARPQAKLTETAVLEIRRRLADGDSCYRLAKEFGVGWSTVKHVARDSTWKHVDLEVP